MCNGEEQDRGEKGPTCHRCKQKIEGARASHVCFIQPLILTERQMETEAEREFVYFDFETTQYLGPHIVNLAVSILSGDQDSEPIVHYTIDEFCTWLFETEENHGRVAIAHNGKGYDFQFIRNWCMRNHRELDVIANGLKIMRMKDLQTGIVFLDSLNFLPMSLSAFTKTFGLGETANGHTLKKGYFPHFANTPLNVATYVGDVPAKKYFGPSSFRKEAERMKFDAWWAKRQEAVENGQPYVFKQELIDYCISDVHLLKAGCEQFRDLFIEHTRVDPFGNVTIASTCMAIFRQNFLPPNTIIRDVPELRSSSFAKMRVEWIVWRASKLGLEVQLPNADNIDDVGWGFDNGVCSTVFHFMSDYDHGNVNVFKPTQFNRRAGTQFAVLNRRRERRHAKWEAKGYTVLKVWQSAWVSERTDEEFKMWREDPAVDSIFPTSALDPRDAFFGGRTNACKLKYEFDEEIGEHGMYVDICSLYPTVNYNDPYPVGRPTIYRFTDGQWSRKMRDEDRFYNLLEGIPDPASIFGFVKCTVTCPDDLYHPVLPTKRPGGKLTFDLESPKTGTWATPEILLALKKGYKIIGVHEMWDYDRTSDLFKEYVETFIKIKQEASGWPAGVEGDEAKEDAYLADFETAMGFQLDKDKVKMNPGLRTLAKLCLNSLWGKFGECINQLQTKIVYTHGQLLELLEDDRYIVKRVTSLTPTATEVAWIMKEEYMSSDGRVGNVNLPIAAFTTSHARTRLYEGLDAVGRQVLYYDTDSIIYKYNPTIDTDMHIPTGNNLGEWTLEAHKLVDTFLSTGPKSYSYTEESMAGERKCVTKVKGFTLNIRNSEQINGRSMRRVIDGRGSVKVATLNPTRIRLNKKGLPVRSVAERKLFGFTYTKRCIMDEVGGVVDTLPWGHRDADGSLNSTMDLSTVEEADVGETLDHPDQGEYALDLEDEGLVADYSGEDGLEGYADLSIDELIATAAIVQNDREHASYLRDYVIIE